MASHTKRFIFSDIDSIRVDQFLATQMNDVSRAYLGTYFASGAVRINAKVAKKSAILRSGDTVTVVDFVHPSDRKIRANPDLPVLVVHEEDNFWVLNKPAGIASHPNDFEDHNTVANFLLSLKSDLYDVGEDALRPGVVHRLDTNTSGLMLAAKTPEGFRSLRKAFDERMIKKTYLALVFGHVSQAGEIDWDLAHHATNPRRMVALKTGKEKYRSQPRQAKTLYEPVSGNKIYTLLKVQTLTGRMHQVRVHMSALGHPLVGDEIYAKGKVRNFDPFHLNRHFLHASTIVIPECVDSSQRVFHSDLSDELKKVLP